MMKAQEYLKLAAIPIENRNCNNSASTATRWPKEIVVNCAEAFRSASPWFAFNMTRISYRDHTATNVRKCNATHAIIAVYGMNGKRIGYL